MDNIGIYLNLYNKSKTKPLILANNHYQSHIENCLSYIEIVIFYLKRKKNSQMNKWINKEINELKREIRKLTKDYIIAYFLLLILWPGFVFVTFHSKLIVEFHTNFIVSDMSSLNIRPGWSHGRRRFESDLCCDLTQSPPKTIPISAPL